MTNSFPLLSNTSVQGLPASRQLDQTTSSGRSLSHLAGVGGSTVCSSEPYMTSFEGSGTSGTSGNSLDPSLLNQHTDISFFSGGGSILMHEILKNDNSGILFEPKCIKITSFQQGQSPSEVSYFDMQGFSIGSSSRLTTDCYTAGYFGGYQCPIDCFNLTVSPRFRQEDTVEVRYNSINNRLLFLDQAGNPLHYISMDPYPAPNTEIWITPCLFPPPNAPVPSPPNIPNSFFLLPPPSIPAFSPPNIPNSVSLVPKSPTSPPAPPKVISDLFPSPPPTPFPSSTSPYTFTAGVGVGVAVASFSLLALICCGKSVKSFFARSQRTSTRTTRELPAIIELVDPSVESRNN